jgi:hypothetical protein
VKRVLCLLFHIHRHSRFEGDAGSDAGTRKGRARRTPTRLVDLASADLCATQPLSWEVDVAAVCVTHLLTIHTDKPGSLLYRITSGEVILYIEIAITIST